jgi:oligopeptide/dipeptide ABC transporter ATP-binding protein
MSTTTPLLEIRKLSVSYHQRGRSVTVLEGIDLDVYAGETLALVGESGCGKTTLGRAMLRLTEPNGGTLRFGGQDIHNLQGNALRSIRRQMQMVFQNPFSSLNPRMSVADSVAEPLHTHEKLSKAATLERVAGMLSEVGLGADYLGRYPHQLSGGQAQRVVIARALMLNPRLLVLDEPTSALDVSVQAQILNLLMALQRQHQLTYVFISHDLGVVRHISTRVAVMYLGEIIETGTTADIFERSAHPYTRALLAATPMPDPDHKPERIMLQGSIPGIANPPTGCRFHTRCPLVMAQCSTQTPAQQQLGAAHRAACHLIEGKTAP